MFKPIPDDDSRFSSANVQAEIYRQCRDFGLKCVCEHTYYFEEEPRATREKIQIDCAVISDGYIVCAAEAKHYSDLEHLYVLDTNQAWNYSLLSVPVYFVARRRHAKHFVNHARGIIQGSTSRQTRHGQIRVISDGPTVDSISVSNPDKK